MKKPIYFTDIDGTLLDLYGEKGTTGILEDMFRELHPTISLSPPEHYDFEEAYGITHGDMLEMFDRLWDIPVPPYKGAVDFVKELKDTFQVLGVTMRPTEESKIAAYRDTSAFSLDGIFMVDTMEEKAPLITKVSEGASCFYLDDKIQTAVDVSLKCLNTRVQLINRPWNKSMDLCLEYDRVFTFDAAADGARFINGRRYGTKENFQFRRDERHGKR